MVLPRAPRHLTPFDPPGPEAAFSHFGFVADRRFRLTITGNSFPEGGNITANGTFRFSPVAAAIRDVSKSEAQGRTICRILTSEIPERYAYLFLPAMTRFQPFVWLSARVKTH